MHTTAQTIKTTTLAIDGMSCGHCVQAVTKALSGVLGVTVKSVVVGKAAIEAADAQANDNALAALGAAGYSAKAVGESPAPPAATPAKLGGCCGGGARVAAARQVSDAGASGGCCG